MVLGIVSVSFCVPAILFSFFRWLPGMLIVLVSLACGILAIVMGARARVLRPAGRAIAGLVLGIIGATVSATAIALSAVGMAKVHRATKN